MLAWLKLGVSNGAEAQTRIVVARGGHILTESAAAIIYASVVDRYSLVFETNPAFMIARW